MKKATFLICFLLTQISFSYGQLRYTNHHEVGLLTYATSIGQSGFSALTNHGVALNPKVSLLLGTGVEHYLYDRMEHKVWIVPITGGVRYLSKPEERSSFVVAGDLGYGLAFSKDDKSSNEISSGGIKVNPMLGWRWKLGEKRSWLQAGVGYQFQSIKLKAADNKGETINFDVIPGYIPNQTISGKTSVDMQRIVLRLGFGF